MQQQPSCLLNNKTTYIKLSAMQNCICYSEINTSKNIAVTSHIWHVFALDSTIQVLLLYCILVL